MKSGKKKKTLILVISHTRKKKRMDFSEPITREDCVTRIHEYIVNGKGMREHVIPPLKALARKSLDLCIQIYLEARRENDQKLWQSMELTSAEIAHLIHTWFNNPQADDTTTMKPVILAIRRNESVYWSVREQIPMLMTQSAMFLPSKLPALPPAAFAANLGLEMTGKLPETISVEDFAAVMERLVPAPLQQAEFLMYWFHKFPKPSIDKYEAVVAQHASEVAIYMLVPKIAEAYILAYVSLHKTGMLSKADIAFNELGKFLSRATVYQYSMCMLNGSTGALLDIAKRLTVNNVDIAKSALLNFATRALIETSVGIHERSSYSDEPADMRDNDLLEFGVFYEMFFMSLPTNTRIAEEKISNIIIRLLQADARDYQESMPIKGTMAYAINTLLHILELLARTRDDSTIVNSDKILNLQGALLSQNQTVVPYKFDLYVHTKILVLYKSLMMQEMQAKQIIEEIFNDVSWDTKRLRMLLADLIVHATLYCYSKKTPFWDRIGMLDILFAQARKIKSRDLACFVLVMASKASVDDDEGHAIVRGWATSTEELRREIRGLGESICNDIMKSCPVSAISAELIQELGIACKGTALIDRLDIDVKKMLSVATYFDYFLVVSGFPTKRVVVNDAEE